MDNGQKNKVMEIVNILKKKSWKSHRIILLLNRKVPIIQVQSGLSAMIVCR